jgi:hypothetical protein
MQLVRHTRTMQDLPIGPMQIAHVPGTSVDIESSTDPIRIPDASFHD